MLGTIEEINEIERAAREQPLSHPLPFSMGVTEFDLPPAPHLIEIYCAVYEAVHGDGVQKLMRLMPREHGKSEATAHVIPSWAALNNPNIRILLLSETEDQAKGKLEQCRETIKENAADFGHKIDSDNKTQITLERSANHDVPTVRAAGFETALTGGHYDLIIFDDIVSWESQRTDTRRDKVWQMFQDYQNLGSAGETTFLVVGTRKHPEDIYARLLDSPGWDCIVEQAISDWSYMEARAFDVVTQSGERFSGEEVATMPAGATIKRVEPTRDVDVLWPGQWSLADLTLEYLSASDGDGSLVWERENQNNARALMGQVLSEDMLHFVEELPPDREMSDLAMYVGMDPALVEDPEEAATDDTDYWAVAVLGYDPVDDQFYLVDIRRRRGISAKQAVDWLEDILSIYTSRSVFIEANQAQRFLVQQCREQGLHVKESQTQGEKEAKITSMSSRFENGRVRILAPNTSDGERGEKWRTFANEWAAFPSGDHDDMLDAVHIALNGHAEERENRKRTAPRPFV